MKVFKLVFIIPRLSGGGAEKVVHTVATELKKHGHDISVLYFDDSDISIYDPGIRLIYLKKKRKLDFFSLIFRTRKCLREIKPDLVASYLLYSNIITVLASFYRKKYLLVLSERNNPAKYLKKGKFSLVKRILLMLTYTQADKIISVSDQIIDILHKKFFIPKKRQIRIHNPVYIEFIEKQSKEPVSHPFFQQTNNIIIGAGRLTEQKRFDLLIRAFYELRNVFPESRLIILGEGRLKEKLLHLVSSLNLNEVVSFPGYQKNPYAWIKKAKVFVLSSDFEGFPNVLVEAMACGTPVVSTNCPTGPDEIIQNGKNGILVPVNDYQSISLAVKDLFQKRNFCISISNEGRKRVMDFHLSKIIPEYYNVFLDLMIKGDKIYGMGS